MGAGGRMRADGRAGGCVLRRYLLPDITLSAGGVRGKGGISSQGAFGIAVVRPTIAARSARCDAMHRPMGPARAAVMTASSHAPSDGIRA